MESGLASLRAELLQRKASAQKSGKQGRPLKRGRFGVTSNKGVHDRAAKDLQAVPEERETNDCARRRLEEKARLYDKISNGTEAMDDDEINEKYLINFQKKIINNVLHKKKSEERRKKQEDKEKNNLTDYEANNPEEEWIEYTDTLGRTRKCQRKDLKKMQEQDIYLSGAKAIEVVDDETAASLIEEKKKELLHKKWEKEEDEAAVKKDMHYQDVIYDEARSLGVGYMQFSCDETERRAQMDMLKELRTDTEQQAAKASEERRRKEKLMTLRLAKVRQRKRLKLGLPMKESEEEDIKTPPESDDEGEIEEETAMEVLPERKEVPPLPTAPPVREWDIGKPGVVRPTLSQERWVDLQRAKRKTEFAPPSSYESVHSDRSSLKYSTYSRNGDEGPAGGASYSRQVPSDEFEASFGKRDSLASSHLNDCSEETGCEDITTRFAPPPSYASSGMQLPRLDVDGGINEAVSRGLAYLRTMSDK